MEHLATDRLSLVIVIPVFNDWNSCVVLLDRINNAVLACDRTTHILIVDDCSSSIPRLFHRPEWNAISRIEVLKLAANIGHQRAICAGLVFISQNLSVDCVIVMDADGQDNPTYIPDLIFAHEQQPGLIVFAERQRRSEGIPFRVGYKLFRLLHWVLLGRRIRFGHFCLIPARFVRRLLLAPEIWLHFAATVLRLGLPYTSIQTDRDVRIADTASMCFSSLALHGLTAISVFIDVALLRILSVIAMILTLSASAFLVSVAIGGNYQIWALVFSGSIVAGLFGLSVLLLHLWLRAMCQFVPLTDVELLVDSICQLETQCVPEPIASLTRAPS